MPERPHPDKLDIGSYWETSAGRIIEDPKLFGEATFDAVVIGAGFTGLSAAITLAGAGVSVCVLDAARVGWGASGRNGGFCCLGGSTLDEGELIGRYGWAATKAFLDYQLEAIDTVARRLEAFGIDTDCHSDGEIYLAHRPKDFDGFKSDADFMQEKFGVETRVLTRTQLAEEGISGPEFHGGLHLKAGFALNPMKYVQGLARKARARGVHIYSRSPVSGIAPGEEGTWELVAPEGRVKAAKVILAANGYADEQVPAWLRGRIMPTMSNILVTRPLSAREQAAQGWTSGLMAADTRMLLHYFRLLPDGRFLFGTRGGLSERPEALKRMKDSARADFDRMFPAWKDVETDYSWHGHVCLARDFVPFVGPIPAMEGVYAAMAWHGSGIALGSLSGERIAEVALGRRRPEDLPQILSNSLRKIPFPALRSAYLQAAYWWFGYQDA
ncbi:FAD-binding oxidoreductase [Roseibium sp. RKSG952]|uniref:NAD(P)/FAD-dependent oxidoreductase n=1 Tax=Roseibium sp. RKSG952 TaxID=2529384 RepID=UPI0012BB6905|nr:FAD-dependent oxidoreductase [Roseibium sp. RKSG952]MTH96490.1 FAD-binding oxidoreductase [Roseibium sp. RKSG952]